MSHYFWVSAAISGLLTATSTTLDAFVYNEETIFTGLNMGLTCATALFTGIAAGAANLKNAPKNTHN
jgi:hypothetical protein